MKARTHLLCLLLLCSLASRAFGLGGGLKEPGLAFPERFPEPARTRILAALRRPDCTFLGGQFINWFTTLRYGGETTSLNRFLDGLAQCPAVALAVRFQREGIPDGCDWLVSHEAGEPGRITVRVNLGSPRMNLEDLVMPEAKGPPLSEAE